MTACPFAHAPHLRVVSCALRTPATPASARGHDRPGRVDMLTLITLTTCWVIASGGVALLIGDAIRIGEERGH